MERKCWNALCTSHAASMTHKTSGCCTLHVLCSTPAGDCFTCTMWSMQERCVEVDSELMGGPINCFVMYDCVWHEIFSSRQILLHLLLFLNFMFLLFFLFLFCFVCLFVFCCFLLLPLFLIFSSSSLSRSNHNHHCKICSATVMFQFVEGSAQTVSNKKAAVASKKIVRLNSRCNCFSKLQRFFQKADLRPFSWLPCVQWLYICRLKPFRCHTFPSVVLASRCNPKTWTPGGVGWRATWRTSCPAMTSATTLTSSATLTTGTCFCLWRLRSICVPWTTTVACPPTQPRTTSPTHRQPNCCPGQGTHHLWVCSWISWLNLGGC